MQPTEIGLGDREATFNLGRLRGFVQRLEDGDGAADLSEGEVVLAQPFSDERVEMKSGRVGGTLLAEPFERERGGV